MKLLISVIILYLIAAVVFAVAVIKAKPDENETP